MKIFSASQKTFSPEELVLQKIGLSRQEALLYLTLLGEPGATVGELFRASALHRPTIYRTLPGLLAKGLVSKEIKGKRTAYRAEPPAKLRPVFEKITEEVSTALPELEAKFATTNERPGIKVIDGKRAVPFLLLDVVYTLQQGETYYRYSSVSPSIYHEPGHLPRHYKQIRDQKNIKRLVITTKAVADEQDKNDARTVKIVPPGYGLFDYNISQFIYGKKIAFVDYSNNIVLIIEHERIANFQTQLFKMLFDRL